MNIGKTAAKNQKKMNTENKIEARLPNAQNWLKTVDTVSSTAKTGYDWTGEFLEAGRMTDMTPGTIIAVCDNAGSGRSTTKDVDLRILCPDGVFHRFARVASDEWAYQLRKPALEWLALTAQERIIRAAKARLEKREAELATATEEAKTKAAANVEGMKKKLAKWASVDATEAAVESPLASYSDADIIAEMRRRGLSL